MPITYFDVPKRYYYKVYDSANTYLGMLPTPSSEFTLSQEINTPGGQITIDCPISIDTAYLQSAGTIQDETGTDLQDENGDALLTEGAVPQVALGTGGALIKNGNRIIVTEFSYYYPNGRVLFKGRMERWTATIGGDGADDIVTVYCYSDGSDLDNFMLTGSPFTYTIDQSQATQNTSITVRNNVTALSPPTWKVGQTFTVGGTGLTNVGAIAIMLTGSATVTVKLWDSTSVTNLYASCTQTVTGASATEVLFTFPIHYYVNAGTVLFYTVEVANAQQIEVHTWNLNVYSGGRDYTSRSDQLGGAWQTGPSAPKDLYFKTYSTTGTTSATFSSQDPSTGMLEAFMTDYIARGGRISYTSGTVDATGLTLTYSMVSNTILDGIKAMLSLSPNGFYWYVNMGTNLLYFKNASTAPDIYLTKGLHIDSIELAATIENVVNDYLFTGGLVSGSNLYKEYTDPTSVSLYGTKLKRDSDNRVTLTATADAIGTSAIATNKDEQFATTVNLTDKNIDTAGLHVGQIVGFRGFGTFVDTLKMQIVRIDYTPTETQLALGIVPKQMSLHTEQITRELIALETIANPTSPS